MNPDSSLTGTTVPTTTIPPASIQISRPAATPAAAPSTTPPVSKVQKGFFARKNKSGSTDKKS